MKFIASKMYCRYVINIINKISMNSNNEKLYDELFDSYIELEKLINLENL